MFYFYSTHTLVGKKEENVTNPSDEPLYSYRFFDKMNLTGSIFQLINGVLLLSTFAGSRLVYGFYQVSLFTPSVPIHAHTPDTSLLLFQKKKN